MCKRVEGFEGKCSRVRPGELDLVQILGQGLAFGLLWCLAFGLLWCLALGLLWCLALGL